ncbi:uncharacterized protein N7473_008468 [Penicillium subrubescens]|uniref:F-box domain-containing protein n=1 Tax=Penicillium subrubescens TaxID=1316194 RepID=A0A1Q5TER0_9EURO|nr:uncharacterized protein N7473_008468 [Penicillium subrubescens]KAJ5892240.1 hypothetical protein N7473_008468 [Penicillium subrubescens]OKO98714.1 hypothetical protein PENSUB_8965 [Penicillium subrubescens]
MPSLRSRSDSHAGQAPGVEAARTRQLRHPDVATPITQQACQPSISNSISASDPEEPLTVFAQHDTSKLASGSIPPAANIAPAEILLQIYSMLTPRDFDNARRTCSQWMRVSLNRKLLEGMLRRAGWWDAYKQDAEKQRVHRRPSSEESDVWRMSKRFATECLLSGRKANVEKSGFLKSEIIDFSGLSKGMTSKARRYSSNGSSKAARNGSSPVSSTFSMSSCSNYILATTGCMIYVFRLLGRRAKSVLSVDLADVDLEPISSIECPFEVLSATFDTTTPGFVVAALLQNRVGMVCDVEIPDRASRAAGSARTNPSSPHFYYNVCSEDHPPRTIALCPGHRCVAFGCAGGIEIHWVDETTRKDQRRHFPMSQPSEILHFLPSNQENPTELRLISSLAGPGVHECACRQSPYPDHPKKCPFHLLSDVQSFSRRTPPNAASLSLVRATHCHHYRAVPINDGFHIIFVEPRTGLLCIGSDAPIGGPTSLTRAFVCVPPFGKDPTESIKEARVPTVFTVGSDLSWGLRVVAAYQDRIVLYSIPLDVFNVIRKERERQGEGVMGDSDLARDWFVDSERFRKRRESVVQNQNGDWEFLLSVSYRPTAMMWPFKIYGKEIGRVDNVVELALQSSNGGARIWAFSASGEAHVFDIDTLTSTTKTTTETPCKIVTVGSDGSLESSRLVDRAELRTSPLQGSRKRKFTELRDEFVGRYGTSRFVPNMTLDGLEPTSVVAAALAPNEDSSIRRPSFAACIVDFKIPELGPREGRWGDAGVER